MILDAAGVKNQQDENLAIWKRCGTTRRALGGASGLRTVYIITIFNSCIEHRTAPWKFSMDIQNAWNLGQVAFQDILQVWLHLLAHFFGQFGKSKSGRTSRKLRYVKDAPSDFWFLISQFALADTCWSQNLGETQRFMATWLKKGKISCWDSGHGFGTFILLPSSICQKSRNHPHEDGQHCPVMRQPLDIFTKCSQKPNNLIRIQQKHLMYWCILPTHMIVYYTLEPNWMIVHPGIRRIVEDERKDLAWRASCHSFFSNFKFTNPQWPKEIGHMMSHGYQWLSRWPHTTEKRVSFFVREDELNHHFTQMDSTHLGLVAPVILALWLHAMSGLEYLGRAWDECGMLKAERRFISILGSFNLTLAYTYKPIFGPYKS